MSVVTVDLPTTLQDWVDSRLSEGEFADAPAYLRALVDRDREKAADVAHLRALIEEGIASGVVDAEPEDLLAEIMSRLPND